MHRWGHRYDSQYQTFRIPRSSYIATLILIRQGKFELLHSWSICCIWPTVFVPTDWVYFSPTRNYIEVHTGKEQSISSISWDCEVYSAGQKLKILNFEQVYFIIWQIYLEIWTNTLDILCYEIREDVPAVPSVAQDSAFVLRVSFWSPRWNCTAM